MHIDNLVKMANQIGTFFEAMPDRDEALGDIASHLKRFWEPRMRRAAGPYRHDGRGRARSDRAGCRGASSRQGGGGAGGRVTREFISAAAVRAVRHRTGARDAAQFQHPQQDVGLALASAARIDHGLLADGALGSPASIAHSASVRRSTGLPK
jgi:hypothetical protein